MNYITQEEIQSIKPKSINLQPTDCVAIKSKAKAVSRFTISAIFYAKQSLPCTAFKA